MLKWFLDIVPQVAHNIHGWLEKTSKIQLMEEAPRCGLALS